MRATANIIIRGYAEGVKESVDRQSGDVTRREWARIDTIDGMTLWCDPGTLNGKADELGMANKDGERLHLRAVADLRINQKGKATFVDLDDLAVTGEVYL